MQKQAVDGKLSAAETEAASTTPATAKADEKKIIEEKKEQKKLTTGQKIKKEVQHYWDGTKLLAAEVNISSRLALKMAAGYELTRRESRQVSTNTWKWRRFRKDDHFVYSFIERCKTLAD